MKSPTLELENHPSSPPLSQAPHQSPFTRTGRTQMEKPQPHASEKLSPTETRNRMHRRRPHQSAHKPPLYHFAPETARTPSLRCFAPWLPSAGAACCQRPKSATEPVVKFPFTFFLFFLAGTLFFYFYSWVCSWLESVVNDDTNAFVAATMLLPITRFTPW